MPVAVANSTARAEVVAPLRDSVAITALAPADSRTVPGFSVKDKAGARLTG